MLHARFPDKISYQAVIRNSEGKLVANAVIGLRVSILHGSAHGNEVYSETHQPQTNANGLFTIAIGNGSSQVGTLANINWADSSFFLKTETDPTGANNYTITAVSQLLSVPYALYAKSAGSIKHIEISGNEPAFNGWDKDTLDDTQTLTLQNNTLSISKGNSVVLPLHGNNKVKVLKNSDIVTLAPDTGQIIYNASEGKLQLYTGSNWAAINAECWPLPTPANAGEDIEIYTNELFVDLNANYPKHIMGRLLAILMAMAARFPIRPTRKACLLA
ncbi:MAG: hypothetical protein HC896_17995 [Bacteroidales bacterium]|nr:hypothetical protein [Bacteroidales bacterium]